MTLPSKLPVDPMPHGAVIFDTGIRISYAGAWYQRDNPRPENPRAEAITHSHCLVYHALDPQYPIHHSSTGFYRGPSKRSIAKVFIPPETDSIIKTGFIVYTSKVPILNAYIAEAMAMWATRPPIVPYRMRDAETTYDGEHLDEFSLYRSIRALQRFYLTKDMQREENGAIVEEDAPPRWKISRKGVSCNNLVGNAIIIAAARYLFDDKPPKALFQFIDKIEERKRKLAGKHSLHALPDGDDLMCEFANFVNEYLKAHPPTHIPAEQLPLYLDLLVMPNKFMSVHALGVYLDTHPLWQYQGILAACKKSGTESIGVISPQILHTASKLPGHLDTHLMGSELDFSACQQATKQVQDEKKESAEEAEQSGPRSAEPSSCTVVGFFDTRRRARQEAILRERIDKLQTPQSILEQAFAVVTQQQLGDTTFGQEVIQLLAQVREPEQRSAYIESADKFNDFLIKVQRLAKQCNSFLYRVAPVVDILKRVDAQLTRDEESESLIMSRTQLRQLLTDFCNGSEKQIAIFWQMLRAHDHTISSLLDEQKQDDGSALERMRVLFTTLSHAEQILILCDKYQISRYLNLTRQCTTTIREMPAQLPLCHDPDQSWLLISQAKNLNEKFMQFISQATLGCQILDSYQAIAANLPEHDGEQIQQQIDLECENIRKELAMLCQHNPPPVEDTQTFLAKANETLQAIQQTVAAKRPTLNK